MKPYSYLEAMRTLANASTTLVANNDKKQGAAIEAELGTWVNQARETGAALEADSFFANLKTAFGLTTEEMVALGYLLLVQQDSSYASFFANLTQPAGTTSPTADLLADVSVTSYPAKKALVQAFGSNSPLVRWDLVSLDAKPGQTSPTIQASADFAQASQGNMPGGLPIQEVAKPLFELAADKAVTPANANIMTLVGGFEARQCAIAYRLATTQKKPLFQLFGGPLLAAPDPKGLLQRSLSAVALQGGLLFWHSAFTELANQPQLAAILNDWASLAGCQVVVGEDAYAPVPSAIPATAVSHTGLPELSRSEYVELWKGPGDELLDKPNVAWNTINDTYIPYYPKVLETIHWTQQEQEAGTTVTTGTVQQSYVQTSPQNLAGIAHIVTQPASFATISLQAATGKAVKCLEQTYLDSAKLPEVQAGLNAIFVGPTGSERVSAAQALAAELGLPIYQINCAELALGGADSIPALRKLFAQAAQTTGALIFEHSEKVFNPASRAVGGLPLLATAITEGLQNYTGLAVLVTRSMLGLNPARFQPAFQVVRFPAFTQAQCADLLKKLAFDKGVRIASNVNLSGLLKPFPGLNSHNIHHIIDRAIVQASKKHPNTLPLVLSAADLLTAIKQELA